MKIKLAEFISFFFHPVVFALLVPFLEVYRHTSNFGYSLKWMFFSAFFLLLALGLFFLMRPSDFFSDFDISKRENRVGFYTISCFIAVLYFIAAVWFKGIFFPLSLLSLGIIIGIILIELVNFYIKVSIHVAVACSFVIMTGLIYGVWVLLLSFWILPLVIWSRLLLKKHTSLEALTGVLIGATVTCLTFAIASFLV